MLKHRITDISPVRDRLRWRLSREMVRDLLEIGVWKKLQEIIHRRIFSAPAAKSEQLIVQIAGRLPGETGKIGVGRSLALHTMTGCARLDALRHVVWRKAVSMAKSAPRQQNGGTEAG